MKVQEFRLRETTGPYSGPLREIGTFVPVEVIYPDLRPNVETLLTLLRRLSRDDTLFICARVNTFVCGVGSDLTNGQQRAIEFICNPDEIRTIYTFASQHGGIDRVLVFFRGQLLELTRWAAKYCVNLSNDGNTFADPHIRGRFLQAALIAGQLWSERVYGDRLSLRGGTDIARVRVLGAFRKGVEESNAAPFFVETLGRGAALFLDYLPRRYPNFDAAFSRITGLTVDQYFVCLAGFAFLLISARSGVPIFRRDTVGQSSTFRDLIPRYLALESQGPEQLSQSLWTDFTTAGYRSIRERPILATEDGRCIIIDPTFFGDRLSIGSLFIVTRSSEPGIANEVFGAFGLAFEDYATDILRRMYPSGSGILASRLSCNVYGHDRNGQEMEVDAILNDVDTLVVFEIKATWLREESILTESEEVYLNQLRAKYGVSSQPGERAKGVAQLARIVGAISRDDWVDQHEDFGRVRLIYPVLVVHDTLLGSFGTGAFLENEFRTLLGGTGLRKRVGQLTVLTTQDLENLEFSVGPFSLREFLFDYTNESQGGARSAHNFMAFSKYKEMLKPSAALMNRATGLLDHARQVLFPPAKRMEHNHIQVRAYFIWEQEGKQHGYDVDHWLRAEAEIRDERLRPFDGAARVSPDVSGA
jgi:hypothetical protein